MIKTMKFKLSLALFLVAQLCVGQVDCALDLLSDIKANSGLADAVKETPDLIDSWKILNDAGRTGLKTNPDAVKALGNLRSNPKLSKLGITDSHLGNMLKGGGWGGEPNVPSFKQLCEEVDELVKALPETQGSNLSDYLGSKGFGISGDAANTRRHSYVQLKRLLENKSVLAQADEVIFERKLVNTINGKPYESFSDVYLKIGNRVVEIETKAGMEFFTSVAGSSSNFAKQSFNSLKNVGDIEDYKVFLNDAIRNGLNNTTDKLKVIEAWKNFEGEALFKDIKIRNQFTDYAKKKLNVQTLEVFDNVQLESFLKSNNDWFVEIFKSNLN